MERNDYLNMAVKASLQRVTAEALGRDSFIHDVEYDTCKEMFFSLGGTPEELAEACGEECYV